MRSILRKASVVALVAACAAPGGGAAQGAPRRGAQVTSAEQLVRAMHDRYAKTWYRTLSFKQTVTRTAPDGTQAPKEVWAEYAEIPGKLRIDLAESYNGNGVIYANDSLYVFRDGALARKSARRNPLLVLGFDVYGQSPERTLQVLREEKFDLSKLHTDSWQGRPVYVVGADAGDLHSPQFWVDRERLLFVRLLEPQAQDTTKTSDIRFDDYRPLGKGWISPTVVFLVDGKEAMREEYFDMKADPALPAGALDPARWGPVR
ncbi:MAG TPA: hypothetical protein VFQ38_19230 [Longimicrobiales bacterium]|nr:hypothetical protein [Longimicrobiales bacterium]